MLSKRVLPVQYVASYRLVTLNIGNGVPLKCGLGVTRPAIAHLSTACTAELYRPVPTSCR